MAVRHCNGWLTFLELRPDGEDWAIEHSSGRELGQIAWSCDVLAGSLNLYDHLHSEALAQLRAAVAAFRRHCGCGLIYDGRFNEYQIHPCNRGHQRPGRFRY
jgi:hypothetical protein